MDHSRKLDSEDDRHLARVLTSIIWASAGVYLTFIIISIFANDRLAIALTLVCCALLSIPLILLRRGHLRLSGLAVMLIELGTLTAISTVGQGIRDISVVAFPVILIFAGLALEPLLFRLCVGLTLGAVCWLALGEHFGLFVTHPFAGGDWFYLTGILVILMITAFSVNLLASNMRSGLERARTEVAQRKQMEEKLEEDKILLRTLIDNLPDRIYALDAQGRKIISNTADWQASGGKTMEDVIGKTDLEIYAPELAKTYWETDRKVIDSGMPVANNEELGLDLHGKPAWVLTSKVPLRNAQGKVIGLVGSGHDITFRKRSEFVQSAIYRISQAAIDSDAVDVLYASIHSILGELIQTENFFIAQYNAADETISFPYFVDQYDERPLGSTKLQGPTGYVIRTGRPLLASRAVFDRRVAQGELQAVGTVGEDWMGAPLKAEGRTIGVIAMKSYTAGIHFSQDDLNLLEFVSIQVAQVIERKRMEEEIRSLSLTDELTGLYNRRGFTLLAEEHAKLAVRSKRSMLLFFCDLDNLKKINDTLGHTQGDLALKEISTILKGTFRGTDIQARYGGDEFVVLAVDSSLDCVDNLKIRLLNSLDKLNLQVGRSYKLSFSMGIAHFDPEAPSTVSEMIAQADGEMYKQKQEKKEEK